MKPLVAFFLAIAASGCAGDESLARARQSELLPGMSKSEVRASIGEPHHVVQDSLTQGREEWVYVYGIPDGSEIQASLEAFRRLAQLLGFFGPSPTVFYRGGSIPDGRAVDPPPTDRRGSKLGARRFSVTFGSDGLVVRVGEVW